MPTYDDALALFHQWTETDALRRTLFLTPSHSGQESHRLFQAVHLLLDRLLSEGRGVLLDATVVRSLLVPGLIHDLGRSSWWPEGPGGTDARPSRDIAPPAVPEGARPGGPALGQLGAQGSDLSAQTHEGAQDGDAHGGAFDFWPGPLGEVLFYVNQLMLAAAVAMTMWSGWEFFRDVRRQRRKS